MGDTKSNETGLFAIYHFFNFPLQICKRVWEPTLGLPLLHILLFSFIFVCFPVSKHSSNWPKEWLDNVVKQDETDTGDTNLTARLQPSVALKHPQDVSFCYSRSLSCERCVNDLAHTHKDFPLSF